MAVKLNGFNITNFCKINNIEVNIKGNIIYFVGINKSGKSTIFKALWAGLTGINEKTNPGQMKGQKLKFIGGNGKTADIKLNFLDTVKNVQITVTRIIKKETNGIKFEAPDGYNLNQNWLDNLLNIQLFSAKYFTETLTAKEQAIVLGINIFDFDKDLKEQKETSKDLRKDLKKFNNLEAIEKIEKVNIEELLKNKKKIIVSNEELQVEYELNKNKELKNNQIFDKKQRELKALHDDYSLRISNNKNHLKNYKDQIKNIQEKIKNCENKLKENEKSLSELNTSLPFKGLELLIKEPEYQNVEEIDDKIIKTQSINEQANLYQEYSKKIKDKENIQSNFDKSIIKEDKITNERLAYIKKFKFGFKRLGVNENGGLQLDGRPISETYFSKTQIELIVAKLAVSLNPKLKIRFIDNFESIFGEEREKLIKTLIDNGFQLLIAEVGDKKKNENTILLKECKIVDSYDETKQEELI